MNARNEQVDGSHYTDMKIQPMEFSMANGLNAGQHTVVKYVSRYPAKGGLQDLLKARHVIELLIAIEYPEAAKTADGTTKGGN